MIKISDSQNSLEFNKLETFLKAKKNAKSTWLRQLQNHLFNPHNNLGSVIISI